MYVKLQEFFQKVKLANLEQCPRRVKSFFVKINLCKKYLYEIFLNGML